MKYEIETQKTAEEAIESIKISAANNKFGVLHIHDLKETLNSKGFGFAKKAYVLDICNPLKAKEVLDFDISFAMVLPCKIAIYEKDNKTIIGMLSPQSLLGLLSDNVEMAKNAKEVDDILVKIINEAL